MTSKPQKARKRKPQVKVQEKRRQDKLAKQHRKRKDKQYNPRRYLTHNQKEVARRILEGEVTMVTSASWAFFEPFLVFLNEVGFFEVIHIEGGKFYRKMMDVALLILTYQVKVLLGIASINQVPARLFRDRALLLLIGYTADQLASGFCCRGNDDKQKPMHKNTLADAVEKLTTEEVEYILNEAVKRLAERGIFKKNCSSSQDANRKSVGGLARPKSATVTILTRSNSRPSRYGAILDPLFRCG